jgi:hypothetical protein
MAGMVGVLFKIRLRNVLLPGWRQSAINRLTNWLSPPGLMLKALGVSPEAGPIWETVCYAA